MAVKINPTKFVLGSNSAVILHAGKSNEDILNGVQGMGLLLGFTMETVTISDMEMRLSLVVPAGGTYQPATASYNFAPGSRSFEEFRDAAMNATLLSDVRLYVRRGCDFSAPDLISDPTSGLYVGTVGDPSVDTPNGVYSGELEYMAGGAFVLYIAHTGTDGTQLSYVSATRTLTKATGSFLTDGFEVGDTCLFDYADGNDPLSLKVESVTASDLVFVDAVGDVATLATDFTGIASTQLHGATPLVTTGNVAVAC